MSIKPGDENLKFLYKYRPLADDSCDDKINKNTLKILENGELFLSKPSDFNDPFDSKIDYDNNASEKEIEDFVISQGFQSDIARITINKIKNGELNIRDLSPKKVEDLLRILCLSKVENNILMWSHYAKDHTGICIGIKVHIYSNSLNIKVLPGYLLPCTDALSKNFIPAKYVDYKNDKPSPVNLFNQDKEKVKPFLERKSALWDYEAELRIVLSDTLLLKNPICIEKTEIGEVIFGLKTSPELEKIVYNIVKEYPGFGTTTNIFKCAEVPGRYAIKKEPYSI